MLLVCVCEQKREKNVRKTREKREKNKNASESTHSVIRPLVFILCDLQNNVLKISRKLPGFDIK